MADAVRRRPARLGLEAIEDDSAAQTGSDSGNVLARIPAPEGARTVLLLCAHLDTVPLDAPVEVCARTASSRTPTRRSSAPTTRRRWR